MGWTKPRLDLAGQLLYGIERNHRFLFWLEKLPKDIIAIVLTNRITAAVYPRSGFSRVLGMLSSLGVQVLCPTRRR